MKVYGVFYSKSTPIYDGDRGLDKLFLNDKDAGLYVDTQNEFGDYDDYYIKEMEVE